LPPQICSCGTTWLILPVRDDALSRARLDVANWEQHLAGTPGANVYVVTSPVDGQTRARMFGYAIGVVEDPATGAAAAALAGYLGARQSDGTSRWTITQGVEMGRPSRLHIEADVEVGTVTAVRVGGSAVRVADGTMRVD
jgi:trans-2,3-dihydro-3-hydroxyanthranilate isomerase